MSAPAENPDDADAQLEGQAVEADGDQDVDDVPPHAGHFGQLVSARCVNCRTVRTKRAPDDVRPDGDGRASFKHVCHSRECRGVTWWNAIYRMNGGDV